MGKKSVIKVGIQLTGYEEQINEIQKQLDAISNQAGGKLSKTASKEIAELKNSIKEINETINSLGSSKVSKKAFSDATKNINQQLSALEKRTGYLEQEMSALIQTMSASDGGKMAKNMDGLKKSMSDVVDESRNVVSAITSINRAVDSSSNASLVDQSSVAELQKELDLLNKVESKIKKVISGNASLDDVNIDTSDVLNAQSQVRKYYLEVEKANKTIKEIGTPATPDDYLKLDGAIGNLVDSYSKLQEAVTQYESSYQKIKLPDKIKNAIDENRDSVAKFESEVIDRMANVKRAISSMGNEGAIKQDKENQSLTIPLDIRTTPKGLTTKAEYIISQTQKAIERTPLEVQFVLISGYSSKRTNSILKNFQKQIDELEDEASKSGLQEVYDKIAKDFSKKIDIEIVSTSLDDTKKKVLKAIDEIKSTVARGLDISISEITVSDESSKGLQARLDSISKNLVLNINKLAISKEATLKASKDSNLKETKKTASEISAEAEALSRVIDRIVGKLNSINKDTLIPIASSLDEIKETLSLITNEGLNTVSSSEVIVSSIREVTSSIQTAFGILSKNDLDKMFLGIQKSVSSITGDLRNPSIKQSVVDVLAQYNEYKKLGGERDVSELGGESNVQKWLKKNSGNSSRGVELPITPLVDADEFLSDVQAKLKGKEVSVSVEPNIDANEFIEKIQKFLVGQNLSIDLNTEQIRDIADSISSLGEKSEPLKYINSLLSKLKNEDYAQSIIVSLEAIRDIFTEPISNENNLINSLSTLASYGDVLKDVSEILKTSNKKVKETIDAIQTPEQGIDLNGRSELFKDAAMGYLSDQGLSVLNTDIRKTKDGLVEVISLVKNLSGEYQSYTLKMNEAMEIEEKQVETSTSSIANTLRAYARAKQVFDRMSSDSNKVTEDAFLNDPDLWREMISLAGEYADRIGDLKEITRQTRQDKDGSLLESFSFVGSKGHVTVGREGEVVASSESLANIEQLSKRIATLKSSTKEYYSLLEKRVSGTISEKELSRLKDIEQEYEDINAQLRLYHEQSVDTNVADSNLNNAIRDMNILYSNMQSGYLDKAGSKIIEALDNTNNKNVQYTPAFKEKLEETKSVIEELNSLIQKNGSDYETWTEADIQKAIDFKKRIDGVVDGLKNQENILAKNDSVDKLLSKIYSDLNDNTAMPSSLKAQYSILADEIKKARDSADGLNAVNYRDLNSQFQKLHAEMLRIGKTGNSLVTLISKSIKSNTAQFIARYFSFQDWIRYGQQLYETIKSIDTALTELRKVSDATEQRLSQNFETSANTAKELGTTITDVINATSDWSRLGFSVDDAEKLAYATTLMQNVGENIDQSSASSYLISTIQGFGLEAENAIGIIDKYNEVANNFAIDTAGIGEAIQRSAASFRAANTDLSEAIALVTTANTVLQDPQSVGTVFKSLSARLRGAKTELEDLGYTEDEIAVTTSKLRDTIMSLTGFDILEDDEETFKSIYDILLGIGEAWDDLTDVERASLGEMLAGKRNSNALYAVLQNVDTLKEVYKTAEESSGSALREQENFEKSIQFSVQRLKASLQELQADFLDAKTVKGIVDIANAIINALDKIIEHPLLATAMVGGGTLLVGFKKLSAELTNFVNLLNSFESVQNAVNAGGTIENLVDATNGLTGAQAAFILSSQGVNAELIEETLIRSGLEPLEAKAIASKYAEATANEALTVSYNGLTTAIKASTKAFIASPVGKIAIVLAAIGAVVGIIDVLTETSEEAEDKLHDIESELQETESELSSISSQIDDIKEKLNDEEYLAVTDPEELERLKGELEYLKQKKQLLDDIAVSQNDKAAKEAYDAANNGQSIFGIGESRFEEADRLKKEYEGANEELKQLYKQLEENPGDEFLLEDIETGKQQLADIKEQFNDLGLLELREAMAKDSSDKYKEEIKRIDSLLKYFTSANDKAVADAQQTADEIEAAYSNIEILSGVQKLTDGMDQLDKIYADVLNKEDFDFSSLLNNESFTNAFGDLDGAVEQFGDAYTNFVETVANSPDDIEATQEAFNNLASAYIYSSAQLDNVNEETAAATTEMLKQWGVVNAEEVVTAALTNNLQDLAWAEETVKEQGYVLTEMSAGQIQSLIQLGVVSEEAGAKIAWFALQEQLANRTGIYTTNDVQQLYNLYQMVGMTGEQLKGLAKLKQLLNQAELSNNASEIIGLQSRINATVAELNKKTEVKLKTIAAPKIDYAGGSATKSAVDKATSSAKEDTEELFDYFERRVEVLNQAIELLGANLENVLGSVAKNQLLDSQRGIYRTELDEYASALDMYQAKANEFLVKLPADIQQKIVNGAVALQDFVGDSEGEVLDAIKSYQEWANKVADCRQKLAELKETLRQLELQKFNNIVDDFTKQFDIRENNAVDIIDKQIALFQEAGELIGESFYAEQKEQSLKQLDILNREKEALLNQLGTAMANGVAAGDDEWNEMISTLSDLDGKILDCKTSVEKFDNAILQIHDDVFKRIQDQFSSFVNELSNARALFEDFDVANIFNEWTENGLAQLGLASQEYELAIHRVQQYEDEIALLNKQYMDGRYSATEYADKLIELKNAQWDAVNAAESAKDAIMSLNEARVEIVVEGINKEIEAYKKATDAMVENLNATEALHDYQKSIADANKDITKMERQLAAMQNDSTSSTIAKRKKLEEQLAQAREDLAEKERDHEVETRIDALNKQYEQFEEEKNNEITALQEGLKARELIIAGSLDAVKENALVIGETINQMTQAHGVVMSEALIGAWTAGENAIASYGNALNANSSQFISNIIGVENETWNLQAKANQTSVALSNMFGNRADALVEEMNRAYYSAENLNNVAYSIQNSFSNAFSSYDTNGIVSSLNTVRAAAENTARALQNANAANNVSIMDGAKIVEKIGKNVKLQGNYSFGSGSSRNFRDYTQYAYAGGVHKLDNDELAWTQELGDEVILSPTRNAILTPLRQGDSVLTAKQSEALFQWAKTSPAEFMRKAIAGKTVIPASNVGDMKLEIGNVLTVNGNIDDTNVKRMESVAQDAINKAFVQLKNGLKR